MTEQEIIQQLKVLLVEKLDLNLKLHEISEVSPLFKGGLNIDSLSIVELIVLIEQHFGFEWADEDVRPANFQDLQTVARLIVQKRAAVI